MSGLLPRFCGVLLLSFLSVSCTKYDHEVKVMDVRKAQVIVIRKEPHAGFVYNIGIRGRGNVVGEARISLVEGGSSRNTENLNGKVRFYWGGDWYSDTAEIRYDPIDVQLGELVLEYSFGTLE